MDRKTRNNIQAAFAAAFGAAIGGDAYDSTNKYGIQDPQERRRWTIRGAGTALALEHLVCYDKLFDDKLECHGLLGLAMVAYSLSSKEQEQQF